jgi:predicted DNA-binding protein
MINKETAEKLRSLGEKFGKDYAAWIYEAIKENFLDDLLDVIYESGGTISPDIVRAQLEKYYNVDSQKDKKKIDYMVNKHQYLLVKAMFDTEK